jgi:hypothetical protein
MKLSVLPMQMRPYAVHQTSHPNLSCQVNGPAAKFGSLDGDNDDGGLGCISLCLAAAFVYMITGVIMRPFFPKGKPSPTPSPSTQPICQNDKHSMNSPKLTVTSNTTLTPVKKGE